MNRAMQIQITSNTLCSNVQGYSPLPIVIDKSHDKGVINMPNLITYVNA